MAQSSRSVAAPLMAQMMERLNIDIVATTQYGFGASMRSAMRRCEWCDEKNQCSQWLKGAPASLAEPPVFCANKDWFAALE